MQKKLFFCYFILFILILSVPISATANFNRTVRNLLKNTTRIANAGIVFPQDDVLSEQLGLGFTLGGKVYFHKRLKLPNFEPGIRGGLTLIFPEDEYNQRFMDVYLEGLIRIMTAPFPINRMNSIRGFFEVGIGLHHWSAEPTFTAIIFPDKSGNHPGYSFAFGAEVGRYEGYFLYQNIMTSDQLNFYSLNFGIKF